MNDLTAYYQRLLAQGLGQQQMNYQATGVYYPPSISQMQLWAMQQQAKVEPVVAKHHDEDEPQTWNLKAQGRDKWGMY